VAFGLLGQKISSKNCGLDDSPYLNEFESAYFDEVYKSRKGDFDFKGKVAAFYTGSSGNTKSGKSNYFLHVKNDDEEQHLWQANGTQLLILTENEKVLSGGYDVIFIFWSKLLKEGKSRKRLVKRLNNTLPNKDLNE